jgi:hypothetical protein
MTKVDEFNAQLDRIQAEMASLKGELLVPSPKTDQDVLNVSTEAICKAFSDLEEKILRLREEIREGNENDRH